MIKNVVKDYKPYELSVNVLEDSQIIDILKMFIKHPPVHHICVVDNNKKLIGLINRKRIFQNVFSHHVATDTMVRELYTLLTAKKAGDLMISHIITIKEDDYINDVISKMLENDLYEGPVVDREMHILGFLTSNHILKKWVEEQKLTK